MLTRQYERQQQREADEDLRDELDADLDVLRTSLKRDATAGPSKIHPSRMVNMRGATALADDPDAAYDQMVRSMAYEARAKPKNRTKTEEELALEEKEKLEKAEQSRQRRMRGEASEDENENESDHRKRRKSDQRGEADDLDDDFDEELIGSGLTRQDFEAAGAPRREEGVEDEVDEHTESEHVASPAEDEESEDSDEEDEDDEDDIDEDEDDEGEGEGDEDSNLAMVDDMSEDTFLDATNEGETPLIAPRAGKAKATPATAREVPYTFTCPSSVEDFEDLLVDLDDSALPTVVQRIRALYHPSLAEGNKEKLQVSFTIATLRGELADAVRRSLAF